MPIDAKQDEKEYQKKLSAVAQYQAGDLPDPNEETNVITPLVPLTAADSIEYIPRKYILDGLIEDETITLFAGKEKIGKTYVLMHMALTMAAERPWLEMPTMADAKGKILWLDFDMNRNTTLRRMNEITNGIEESWHVKSPHLFDNFLMMDAKSFRDAGYVDRVQFFDESDAVNGLRAFIIAQNVKVCFIDNLVQIEGSAQENSSNDIQKVFSGIKQLRDETHCAFVIIHHTTKDGFRGRGSSDIFGETDLNLQLDQVADDDKKLILKTDGARNAAGQDIGLLKRWDWRIGEEFAPIEDANGHYIYNFKLERIAAEGLTLEGKKKERRDEQIRKNVERIVLLFQKKNNIGMTKNGIINASKETEDCDLSGTREIWLSSIDAAAEQGLIVKDEKFYHLPLIESGT